MGKWWSVLFGVVMAACAGLFVVAPMVGWWLPPGVSKHSWDVDYLFYVILAITGFFFILTEALLVVFMFQYAGRPGGGHVFGEHPFQERVYWTTFFKRIFRPVSAILHNQHRVELTWTAVPAIILLYIAFAQVGTWLDIKDKARLKAIVEGKEKPIQIAVSARQFEWRVRYPSSKRLENWLNNPMDKEVAKDFESFARNEQLDDVKDLVNEIHLWKGQTLLVQLSTVDVIHSFNIPYMRVKQDALPGKVIPVWFTPIRANTHYDAKTKTWVDAWEPETGTVDPRNYRWEIACAELCGWGHHRMIGRVYVHETREAFFQWLKQVEQSHSVPQGKILAAR